MRTVRFPLLSRLLLVLALLALGGELAVPAFAGALGARSRAPCHEQALAHEQTSAREQVSAQRRERDPHHHDRVPLTVMAHPCCALACLLVAPVGEGPATVVAPRRPAWTGLAVLPLAGLTLPIPVPPPRSFS